MSRLDEILALTDEVEHHIDQGDWLEAGRVNARRQALLVELCEEQARPGLDPGTRAVLGEVLNRNRETESRLRGARQQIADAASRIEQNRAAVNAYRRNTAERAGDY